jgi:hypothetical protein
MSVYLLPYANNCTEPTMFVGRSKCENRWNTKQREKKLAGFIAKSNNVISSN